MSNELPSTPEQWVAYLKDLTGVTADVTQNNLGAVMTLASDQDGLLKPREVRQTAIPETYL